MSLLRIWTCSTCSAAGVVYSRLAAPCAINNVLHLCFLCFMCFRISGCSGLRPAFYDKCVNKTHDISSTWPGFPFSSESLARFFWCVQACISSSQDRIPRLLAVHTANEARVSPVCWGAMLRTCVDLSGIHRQVEE